MKAIVTGGAGFIGSHLVNRLLSQDVEVSVLDNMASGKPGRLHPLASCQRLDIRSKEALQNIVRLKPDVVFHLAAQTDVQTSLADPKYDSDVNIGGTINVLEACREAGVRKIIFASTSAVYGNSRKRLISEDDPIAPISVYGASKLAAESFVRLYHQLYGIFYTILRFSNVYGPGQTPKGEGGVVAVFLERILGKRPVFVHGDGDQTRDFIHVKDVVLAMTAAIERGDQETCNVSTSNKTSVNHLAAMLSRIHGEALEIVHQPSRRGDVRHSCLDNRKASRQLSWQPTVGLGAGLSDTYAFSKRNMSNQGDEGDETARHRGSL